MKVIYVDDEKLQLENFRLTVEGMAGIESLKLFSDSREAYEWAMGGAFGGRCICGY